MMHEINVFIPFSSGIASYQKRMHIMIIIHAGKMMATCSSLWLLLTIIIASALYANNGAIVLCEAIWY